MSQLSSFFVVQLFLVWVSYSANLICNGDFEQYQLFTPYYDCVYQSYPSNINCWHSYNLLENIEVKKFNDYPTSKGGDLTPIIPIKLCQTLNLKVGSQYVLSYDLFCQKSLSQMTFKIWLNDVEVDQLYIESQATFSSGSTNLAPQVMKNEICFSETHTRDFFFLDNFVGGFVDNVTLVEIQENVTNSYGNVTNITENKGNGTNGNITNGNVTNGNISNLNQNESNLVNNSNQSIVENTEQPQEENFPQQMIPEIPFIPQPILIIINFKPKIKEKERLIHIHTNFSALAYFDMLNQNLLVRYDGQILEDTKLLLDEDNFFVMEVGIHRTMRLDKMKMALKDQNIIPSNIKFKFLLEGKGFQPMYHLSDEEREFIESMEPIIGTLINSTQAIYQFSSSSLSSVILFNFFSFWNLSLLYNFLVISSLPNFTAQIYEQIKIILFKDTSLANLLESTLNLPENTFSPEFEQTKVQEHMHEYKEMFVWFGSYGFSSKFIGNNIDMLLEFVLLMIKFLVIKIVSRMVCEKVKKFFEIQIDFLNIVLLMIVFFSPFVEIGAFVNIGKGCLNYVEKFQKVAYLICLGICLLGIPFWVIYKFSSIKKQVKKKKRKQEKVTKEIVQQFKKDDMREECINDQICDRLEAKIKSKMERENKLFIKEEKVLLRLDILEMALHLTIPILVILEQVQAFFIINSTIFIYRTGFLIANFRWISMKSRIFKSLMTLIWVVHHFTFAFLYLVDILREHEIIEIEDIQKPIIICGIIVLITLVLGCLFDLLEVAVNLIGYLGYMIKKIYRICKQDKNKIKDKASNEENKIYLSQKRSQKFNQKFTQQFVQKPSKKFASKKQHQKEMPQNELKANKLQIEDIQSV